MSRIKIRSNPELTGMAEMIPGVVYATPDGKPQTAEVLLPWQYLEGDERVYPFVLFIQGSGWTFPNVWPQIPLLGEMARRGYVVATITHRNAMEGNPYPAFLDDARNAFDFFKEHAAQYHIDTERMGIWGTSSGANTALLLGMEENNLPIRYIVGSFPTTDMIELYDDENFDSGIKDCFEQLCGGTIDYDILKEMSPYHKIENGKSYPPMYISHGTKDELIPCWQSEKFYNRISEETSTEILYAEVEDAPHEGSYWSKEMIESVLTYIKEHSL